MGPPAPFIFLPLLYIILSLPTSTLSSAFDIQAGSQPTKAAASTVSGGVFTTVAYGAGSFDNLASVFLFHIDYSVPG